MDDTNFDLQIQEKTNIDAEDRTEESAEDITAAETAPIPTKDTAFGVRYWKTSGTTIDVCSRGIVAPNDSFNEL
jgi:hypothetical protein